MCIYICIYSNRTETCAHRGFTEELRYSLTPLTPNHGTRWRLLRYSLTPLTPNHGTRWRLLRYSLTPLTPNHGTRWRLLRYSLTPLTPNHGTRWRLTVSVKNPPLHPRGKDPTKTTEWETGRTSRAQLNALEWMKDPAAAGSQSDPRSVGRLA
jgi:hypothetical protein